MALLIVTIINGTGWAYFLLRAANPNSRESRHLASEIHETMRSPTRPSSTAEINRLLQDLGPYSLGNEAGELEFGFPTGSVRKLLLQGPEVLNYVRRDAAGKVTLAQHYSGGFAWKMWHIAQTLRSAYPAFRRFTYKKPHAAWWEIGVRIDGSTASYSDEATEDSDILYCFPGCLRAEGGDVQTAAMGGVAIPFLFGPRRQIVYSSGLLSQTH